MKKLNVVYAYMVEPRFDIPLPDHDALVVWTAREEPDADIVLYYSGYSYDPKRAAANPTACRILYTYEPLTVYPPHFRRGFWHPFDYVLTWNETLVEQGPPFVRFPSVYYDFPFGSVHGVTGSPHRPPDWQNKRRAICQVAGNKYSLVPSELYSRRRKIARWFGRHGTMELDTFGVPAMPVPGYRGRAADKIETLSQYWFALCLENESHPLWSRGYVTEKIFDCFYAFSVPIYLGAADIEHHVPPECFIDYRHFDSLDDLDRFLSEMPDDTYGDYLHAIEQFLGAYDAPSKHSCLRIYEQALELAAAGPPPPPTGDLYGFWQRASLMEKVMCTSMTVALKFYEKVRRSRYSGMN